MKKFSGDLLLWLLFMCMVFTLLIFSIFIFLIRSDKGNSFFSKISLFSSFINSFNSFEINCRDSYKFCKEAFVLYQKFQGQLIFWIDRKMSLQKPYI